MLVAEVISALSLTDLLIELVDDDGNEQVHDEEGGHEDVEDEDERDAGVVVLNWRAIVLRRVDTLVHHARPHLKGRDLEEGKHGLKNIIVVIDRNFPFSFLLNIDFLEIFSNRFSVFPNAHSLILDILRWIIALTHLAFEQLNTEDSEDKQE